MILVNFMIMLNVKQVYWKGIYLEAFSNKALWQWNQDKLQ